ncbi:hypothetical protein BLS_003770 [Venturia inaequalis]|uniref:Uncharacterized protein n=1 Tax=Venturia inaequalis TaxID=5025 RepID=A0A8H3YTM8_VENIN|nr:hypothetical protein BLS_003770 [Venturia inaequalis]KAE9980660.1 hypothetical protein EG327_006495 [Venturia inaequalis]
MRSDNLVAVLLILVPSAFAADFGRNNVQKRQTWDFLGSAAETLGTFRSKGYGKVPDPPGAAPRRVTLEPDFQPVPGTRKVKIRSGPYKVPNMGVKSLSGHAGMLEGYYDKAVEKPCENCNILRQVGGLEFVNGSNANIESGLWLHHMVMMNQGPRRWDPVGVESPVCVPFVVSGTSPSKAERYFVTGNERTPFTYYIDGIEKAAYHLDPEDKFGFILELMNMNMQDEVVYITQTYDILDGPLPAGWKETKTVFLDVKSCGTSESSPPDGKSSFLLESKPWIPNIQGKILNAGGHLHDGGAYVDVFANSTDKLCQSVARYSEKPEYIWRGTSMDGEKVAKDHISSMGGCETKQLAGKEMNRDQSWVIQAQYDFNQKAGNEEGGKMAEVMGIAIVLVAVQSGPLQPLH